MKKALPLLIIFSFSILINVHAQEVFQKVVTLPNLAWYPDYNHCVKITMDKGLLIVKGLYMDNLQESGITVTKLDSNLNVQWTRDIYTENGDDDIRDILLTKDSGFVLAGQYFNYSGWFDSRSYIKKINSKGDLVWEKSFYWKSYNAAERLVEDNRGNIIAIGNTSDDYFGYGWAAKIDVSGNVLWSHVYTNSTELSFLTAVTTTSDGGYAFLGSYHTEQDIRINFFAKANKQGVIQESFLLKDVYFDKIKQMPDSSYILYGIWQIAKLDKDLNVIWTKQINATTYTTIESVTLDSNKNLVAAARKRVAGDISGSDAAISHLLHININNGNIITSNQLSNDTAFVNRDIVSVPDGYIIAECLFNTEFGRFPARYKLTRINKALSGCNMNSIADTAVAVSFTESTRKISIVDTLKKYAATSTYVTDSTNYSIVETKCADIILPLKLINFTAQKTGSYNTLYWTTSGDQNIKAFEIERSSDAVNFSSLGIIDAHRNTLVQNNYTYQDKNSLQGDNHYRLKIIDNNGKYSYSIIKTIPGNNNFYVSVYPNPVGNAMKLKINSNKETLAQLKIIDIQGRVLMNNRINILAGESEQLINTSFLTKGVYIVQVISSGGQQQIKIIK